MYRWYEDNWIDHSSKTPVVSFSLECWLRPTSTSTCWHALISAYCFPSNVKTFISPSIRHVLGHVWSVHDHRPRSHRLKQPSFVHRSANILITNRYNPSRHERRADRNCRYTGKSIFRVQRIHLENYRRLFRWNRHILQYSHSSGSGIDRRLLWDFDRFEDRRKHIRNKPYCGMSNVLLKRIKRLSQRDSTDEWTTYRNRFSIAMESEYYAPDIPRHMPLKFDIGHRWKIPRRVVLRRHHSSRLCRNTLDWPIDSGGGDRSHYSFLFRWLPWKNTIEILAIGWSIEYIHPQRPELSNNRWALVEHPHTERINFREALWPRMGAYSSIQFPLISELCRNGCHLCRWP